MTLLPRLSRNSPGAIDHARRSDATLVDSELRYRRLFEGVQEGILIADGTTGRVIDINPYLLDLLGYPLEGVVGRELWEIGAFDEIAPDRDSFEELRKGEYVCHGTPHLRSNDGKEIAVEFVSNVYRLADAPVIQCCIRDIRPPSTLPKDDCNDRIAALRVAGSAKDHVLAILSHELRTPLNAISAMLDLVELGNTATSMLSGVKGPPDAEHSAIIVIRRNVANLVRLIDDLLDLSQFAKTSIALNLAQVDAHDVILLALNNLEHEQTSRHIAVTPHLHATNSSISADAPKLEQIICNLVGNALKFTPRGGTVSIVTRNNEAGDLLIDVQDTGIGIAEEALGRIFSPFEQADASIHPRFGGLGLGLSIAHTLVDLHGGSLQATSNGVGCGATFTVCFKGAFAAPAIAASNGSAAGFRILLAEDNRDARRCVATLLESAGYEVYSAADIQSALELGDNNEFDLLVSDLGLPDGTGGELLLKLRARDPGLQAIAMSGYGLQEDLLNSRAVGFLAHLVKPVHFAELKEAIAPVVATKGSKPRPLSRANGTNN